MTGTPAGAPEARGIASHPDKMLAEVNGTIENVESKPLITRIRVNYHLKVPKGKGRGAKGRQSPREELSGFAKRPPRRRHRVRGRDRGRIRIVGGLHRSREKVIL